MPETSGEDWEPLEDGPRPEPHTDPMLEVAFDLSPLGMAVLDQQLGFRMVNDVYCSMLGYKRNELLGLYLPDITHPEDHWLDQEWFDFVFDEAVDSFSREKRVMHREGEAIWVKMNSKKAIQENCPTTLTVNTIEPIAGDQVEAAEAATKLEWSTRITDALAQEKMVLHGQPIIDLRTGAVTQHELLLRMCGTGSRKRLIQPREFMPPAEKHGLVDQIDLWVTNRGLEIAREMPVTVNLSGSTISKPALIESIERAVVEAGVPSHHLMFEITETAVVENLSAASEFVHHLHRLGCKFALDDFGTGYGTFAYLKRLDVDYLKIDIEFVRDLTKDESDQKIVRSIAATAELFGIATIAEGVENAETLELLRRFGVDYAQGFHIGRPSDIGG